MLIVRQAAVAVIVIAACVLPSSAGLIWYAAETAGSTGWSHLYNIDTATSAIADRGLIHGQRYITDLAIDVDGVLYGVGWKNGMANGSSKLYKITPGDADTWAQWEIVTVKSSKMNRTVNGAVMQGGDLYVSSFNGTFQKLSLDAAHDRWEVVKNVQTGYALGGDLAFSGDGSALYVALQGGVLGRMNYDAASKDFGKVTTIGNSGYDDLYGLAWTDGKLYATTNGHSGYGTSYLVSLDVQTALAGVPVSLGRGVWGAASGPAVPEPATLVILAGGVALVIRRRSTAKA